MPTRAFGCGRYVMYFNLKRHAGQTGFTLVELSIVLVIIGLIIGAITVGLDLINSAAIRAQVAQIEKYQTALNTFRSKYGYLPGDIPDPTASQFGFTPRGANPGEGDGNDLLEGVWSGAVYGSNDGYAQGEGETVMFWMDVSQAGLIDGKFDTVNPLINTGATIPLSGLSAYWPPAKIGQGNYVYVWNGGWFALDHYNFFGISAVTDLNGDSWIDSDPGLTVTQAYSIDVKIDDGLPQTGKVIAEYLNYALGCCGIYAAGGGNGGQWNTAGTSPSATTCYDNDGVAGTQHYSIGTNNGMGMNCALSFQFQ